MKIKAFTPQLREEVAKAAVTLKDVITTAQAGAAEYYAHQQQWKEFSANREHHFKGQAIGESHPFLKTWVAREKEHNESETWVNKERALLTNACHATSPILDRIFDLAYQQIHAELEALLQPYYRASTLKVAAQGTELERNLLSFSLRLTHGDSRLFHETLNWAQLVLKVLEDLAAGKEVFTITPEVAKAA